MANYKDFTFNRGKYGKAQEVSNNSTIVLAIKNIILSKPCNFPFSPSLGVDIEKYEFELGDEKTLNEIKTNILGQIGKFIPSLEGVFLDIRLIDDTNKNIPQGRKILAINIKANNSDGDIDTNFLLYKEFDGMHIYNETK